MELEGQQSLKEKHQQLSAVIKDVHKQLRREYRENGRDHVKVWEKHTSDAASLERYATAMQQLATQHWAKHPDTRIEWCRKTALEYFRGGGMQRALHRDTRRRGCRKDAGYTKSPEAKGTEKCESAARFLTADTVSTSDETTETSSSNVKLDGEKEEKNTDHVPLPPTDVRLRLLDVGSCYNPFLEYPEFDSIGIDLSPASETVYQCDFLKLKITSDSSQQPCMTPDLNYDPSGSGVLSELPCSVFHVVVFSLLLEYLPAPAQRWTCCVNAHKLLVSQGLLLIITPDSNSAYRNHPMMRSWREALEYLGFDRWKYHKMEHVHCMAYRKVREYNPDLLPSQVEQLLYIPQDSSDACYNTDHLPPSQQASRHTMTALGQTDPLQQAEQESFVSSCDSELPLFDGDEL